MKIYRGHRDRVTGCHVTVTDGHGSRELPMRRDLADLAPGFGWGYAVHPARQLALAMLCDLWGDDGRALCYYEGLAFGLIAGIQTHDWELTDQQVRDVLDRLDSEARERATQTEFLE